MKHYISLFLILLFLVPLNAQETYFSRFKIKSALKSNLGINTLKKETSVTFDKLPKKERKKYIAILKKNKGGELIMETKKNALNIKKTSTLDVNKMSKNELKELFGDLKFTTTSDAKIDLPRKGHVKFKDDKVIVNFADKSEDQLYHYKLRDGEFIYLKFNEFLASGLTVPLKYRTADSDDRFGEQFTSSFNANLFIGYTFYGLQSFYYRKGMDNKSNTFKMSGGFLVGASTVKLNSSNTSIATEPLSDEITEGVASLGGGLTITFNKLNFGLFAGRDYSLGDNGNKWNYNKQLWYGFGLGYSLFKI